MKQHLGRNNWIEFDRARLTFVISNINVTNTRAIPLTIEEAQAAMQFMVEIAENPDREEPSAKSS